MKFSNVILVVALMASTSYVFAHGEDKSGPNGGKIRMPGAFHTEAVIIAKNKLKVYLLDINFKHPTVKNSSIKVSFAGNHHANAICAKNKKFFVCSFDKGVDLNKPGTLEINPIYMNQIGATAVYETPL